MKGQLFSIDFMIALGIFILTLGLVLYLGYFQFSTSQQIIERSANTIADNIVSNKLGEENILDCVKVTNLASKTYDTIRNETNAYPYDIFIEFMNTTPICGNKKVNIGNKLTKSRTATAIVRIVYLDGQKIQMVVRLYA